MCWIFVVVMMIIFYFFPWEHIAFFSVIKMAASNVLDICSRYDNYLLFLSSHGWGLDKVSHICWEVG
jgi:fructose-1,6-bisphosphatase